MQILYLVAEIGTSKTKILVIFHVIFFNKDMSVTTVDITITFSMTTSHIHSKERVSRIFHLGSVSYLEKSVLKISQKLPIGLDKMRTKP